jgi:Flp pilus assembly pilin Flp
MFHSFKGLLRNRRGQSMVEYGILVGAIAVVCLAGTALLGHKVASLIGISAAVLPGVDTDDTGAVFAGKLVQTSGDGSASNPFGLSSTPGAVSVNLGLGNGGASSLIVDTPPSAGS